MNYLYTGVALHEVYVKVHLEIEIHQGRINYNDLLTILSEDKIYRIETTEEGLRIEYGDYVLTIKLGYHAIDSITTIEITGETTSMDLVELAEKINDIAGKILRLLQ